LQEIVVVIDDDHWSIRVYSMADATTDNGRSGLSAAVAQVEALFVLHWGHPIKNAVTASLGRNAYVSMIYGTEVYLYIYIYIYVAITTHHPMCALLSRMSGRYTSSAAVHPVYDVEELVHHGDLLVTEMLLLLPEPAAAATIPGVHYVQPIRVVRLRRHRDRRSTHPKPFGPHPKAEFGIVGGPSQLAPDCSHYLFVLGTADDFSPATWPVVLSLNPFRVPSPMLFYVLLVRHPHDRSAG